MFQVFDQVAFVEVEEGLSVDKLGEVLPDESIHLIKKPSRVEDRRDFADIKIALKLLEGKKYVSKRGIFDIRKTSNKKLCSLKLRT